MKAEELPLESSPVQDESSESEDHMYAFTTQFRLVLLVKITRFPLSSASGMSLGSATFVSTFDLTMVPKLFSALSLEVDEASCAVGDEDKGPEG